MVFRIENNRLKIVEATRTEYHQLQIFLTRYVEGYKYQKTFKLGVWDGTVSFFEKEKGIAFGLWLEIKKHLQQLGFEFKIENIEEFPVNKAIELGHVEEWAKEFFKNHKHPDDKNKPMIPYDYQLKAVQQILKYRFCNVEVGTGGGKSLIYGLFMFYYMMNIKQDAKFLIIVPTIGLVKQFYNDLNAYNDGFYKENQTPLRLKMSEVMSNKPRQHAKPNIVIGTYQSLEKESKTFFQQFDCITVDEAHKAKAASLKTILSKTVGYAQYRFGMSGTFPDAASADYLTVLSLTGPIVSKVETHKLIELGTVTPVKIKAVILNHNDPEFRTNLYWIKQAGRGKDAYDLEREYIHNSKKRTDFIIDKLISKVTKNTLVLFHTIEYGTMLYNECRDRLTDQDVYYVDGAIDGESREAIKKTMEDTSGKKPKILIASFGTFSTGISVKSLSNVIFADSFKSEQIIIQSIGRILRLHNEKEIATVFDIVDVFDQNLKHQSNVLYKHYMARKLFYDKRQYPNDSIQINL